MVRYPHTATLIIPGDLTWIKGKAVTSQNNTEDIECDIQPDGSNFEVTLNSKSVTAKYSVFLSSLYQAALSAKQISFWGNTYDILQAFPYQHGITLKIG